jgi:hypothetical protein
MNNKAQFTPLKKAVHVIPMLYAEAFAGSNNKEFVVELYEDARLLETAAPAMYEALQAIEARLQGVFDSPALMRQGMLTHDKSADVIRFVKAALAQAEGR